MVWWVWRTSAARCGVGWEEERGQAYRHWRNDALRVTGKCIRKQGIPLASAEQQRPQIFRTRGKRHVGIRGLCILQHRRRRKAEESEPGDARRRGQSQCHTVLHSSMAAFAMCTGIRARGPRGNEDPSFEDTARSRSRASERALRDDCEQNTVQMVACTTAASLS
jgi:hypothetical protein